MLKIAISSHSRYPIDRKDLRRGVRKALAKHGLRDDYRVHIMVVGNRQMTELNRRFMGKNKTAEVLSFPLIDLNNGRQVRVDYWPKEPDLGLLDLGEIVVSYPQAKKQAIAKNITLDKQVRFLVEHGLEHLMGHHHE
jgi:probable rRNA maturation factor